mgnify:CR=1 FL=1
MSERPTREDEDLLSPQGGTETERRWVCGCGYKNETYGGMGNCEHECASCGRRTFVEDME